MRSPRLRALVLALGLAGAAAAPGIALAQSDSVAVAEPAAGGAPAPEAAAPGPRVRGPRIPGTALRLGDSLSVVRGSPDLRAMPDPELAPGELAYGGPLRFYGGAGNAKLVFHDGALVRATIVLKPASPRTCAYVEDYLRRLGYRADCRPAGGDNRDCDWLGPLSATVRADTAQLSADFGSVGMARVAASLSSSPAGAPVSARSLQSVLESDSMPILPDTLDLREDNPNGYPKPVIAKTAFARIPDDIRGSVERGIVTLIAFVGAEGQVQYVTPIGGPEELKEIAVAAAMRYRFQRYQIKEGRRRFWVRMTIYPA